MALQINQGTQTSVYTKTNGGTEIQIVKLDVGSGTAIADFGGSIVSVGTMPGQGTLTNVGSLTNVGTIKEITNLLGGTIFAGTYQLNPTPIITPLILGTLGTAGGSFFATVSAASGAGTKHYVSSCQIVVQSGTPDVRILAGSSILGTGVIAAGAFPPGGGIEREFNPPFVTGTNSELIYHFVGAGTAMIVVNYWKGA